MTKPPVVFVREATGLVRAISPWVMLWANIGEIGFGTGLLLMNDADSFLPAGNPGGNVVIACLFFMIIVLFMAYIYNAMIPAVGRSGGDYVFISRTLGPFIGSILGYGFVLAAFPFLAISLNWMFTLSLIPSISTIGVVTGNSGIVSLASALGAPVFLAVACVAILTVMTILDIVSPKKGFMSLALFAVLGTIGTIMMALVFAAAGPSGIQSSVANLLSQNNATYTGIASQYTGPAFSWFAIVLLFPFAYYYLPFFNNAAAFSGELKNIKRSAFYGTFVAAIFSGGLMILFLQMYYSYLGFNFAMQAPMSWPSALTNAGVFPNMLTIATIAASNNTALIWIMNVLFAIWYLAAVQQVVLGISRYIFAMSFDWLLPVKLASVSDRFHSPVTALLVQYIVTLPMIYAVCFTNWLFIFSSTGLTALFLASVGISAIIYGWKRRDTLKNSFWLIASGVVQAISFLGIAYMVFALPYYGINIASWVMILVIVLIGALAYPIAKTYLKRKGLDLAVVFKQIPPE